MTTWIGADWDSAKCVVALAADGGPSYASVKRNPHSVRRFVERQGADEVVVGIEDGDPLWVGLWRAAGATVHVFDPQKAKSYTKSLRSSGAGDDPTSARALLAMVQSPAHRTEARRDLPESLRGLERLLSAHTSASDEVTRHSNRLRALLRQFHPALEATLNKVGSRWLTRLVEAVPTPSAWTELPVAERGDLLRAAGVRATRWPDVERVLGEQWIVLSPAHEQAARVQLRSCARLLRAVLREQSALRKALDQATLEDAAGTVARQTDGLGPVHAAAYAVAYGDGSGGRDGIATRLAQCPVTNRSGELGNKAPKVSMRRACRDYMRRAGSLVAVQLVMHHPWAAAAYAYYRGRGKTAFAAYRRIGRSFSRAMYACIRDDKPFDPERYVAALKAKGVQWAIGLKTAA